LTDLWPSNKKAGECPEGHSPASGVSGQLGLLVFFCRFFLNVAAIHMIGPRQPNPLVLVDHGQTAFVEHEPTPVPWILWVQASAHLDPAFAR
jgi:hypothetical protein